MALNNVRVHFLFERRQSPKHKWLPARGCNGKVPQTLADASSVYFAPSQWSRTSHDAQGAQFLASVLPLRLTTPRGRRESADFGRFCATIAEFRSANRSLCHVLVSEKSIENCRKHMSAHVKQLLNHSSGNVILFESALTAHQLVQFIDDLQTLPNASQQHAILRLVFQHIQLKLCTLQYPHVRVHFIVLLGEPLSDNIAPQAREPANESVEQRNAGANNKAAKEDAESANIDATDSINSVPARCSKVAETDELAYDEQIDLEAQCEEEAAEVEDEVPVEEEKVPEDDEALAEEEVAVEEEAEEGREEEKEEEAEEEKEIAEAEKDSDTSAAAHSDNSATGACSAGESIQLDLFNDTNATVDRLHDTFGATDEVDLTTQYEELIGKCNDLLQTKELVSESVDWNDLWEDLARQTKFDDLRVEINSDVQPAEFVESTQEQKQQQQQLQDEEKQEEEEEDKEEEEEEKEEEEEQEVQQQATADRGRNFIEKTDDTCIVPTLGLRELYTADVYDFSGNGWDVDDPIVEPPLKVESENKQRDEIHRTESADNADKEEEDDSFTSSDEEQYTGDDNANDNVDGEMKKQEAVKSEMQCESYPSAFALVEKSAILVISEVKEETRCVTRWLHCKLQNLYPQKNVALCYVSQNFSKAECEGIERYVEEKRRKGESLVIGVECEFAPVERQSRECTTLLNEFDGQTSLLILKLIALENTTVVFETTKPFNHVWCSKYNIVNTPSSQWFARASRVQGIDDAQAQRNAQAAAVVQLVCHQSDQAAAVVQCASQIIGRVPKPSFFDAIVLGCHADCNEKQRIFSAINDQCLQHKLQHTRWQQRVVRLERGDAFYIPMSEQQNDRLREICRDESLKRNIAIAGASGALLSPPPVNTRRGGPHQQQPPFASLFGLFNAQPVPTPSSYVFTNYPIDYQFGDPFVLKRVAAFAPGASTVVGAATARGEKK